MPIPRAAVRLLAATATLAIVAPAALGQMPPASVRVAPVERAAVTLTQPLVASVEPVTRATLAADFAGVVLDRTFEEGQRVAKGQPLVSIDAEVMGARHAAAEAAVRSAEAQLERARIEAANTAREAARQESLFRRNAAPEKEFLDARSADDRAQASIAVSEAEVAQRQAEAREMELMLAKASVASPLDGVVERRYAEIGQWLDSGDPVADVVQLDPLFVRVGVPERVVTSVKPGDTAEVMIPALGGRTFEGTVDQIVPVADPQSRTFPVRILLPNPDGEIRPGFFARATLRSSGEQSFQVPKDAVVNNGTDAHVVVVRDGAAAIVPVTLGVASGETVGVTGELADGDRVVVRGNESLMPGQPLNVQE